MAAAAGLNNTMIWLSSTVMMASIADRTIPRMRRSLPFSAASVSTSMADALVMACPNSLTSLMGSAGTETAWP